MSVRVRPGAPAISARRLATSQVTGSRNQVSDRLPPPAARLARPLHGPFGRTLGTLRACWACRTSTPVPGALWAPFVRQAVHGVRQTVHTGRRMGRRTVVAGSGRSD
ncbi:hypothetical protein GCM10027570_30340 [Streptomonospora sediminis]